MRRALALLSVVLALAGCADATAHRARTALLGAPKAWVISHLGHPASVDKLDTGDETLTWNAKQLNPTISVPVPFTSTPLQLDPPSACSAVVTFHLGRASQVHFVDTEWSTFGRLKACDLIVDDFMRDADSGVRP